MAGVFVSYRRGDAEGQARALVLTLSRHVGKDAVFIDVDNIAPGRDFRQVLEERLASCELMLALIGIDWLDAKDSSGNRRLEDPNDYVRQEIATALKRNISVTPVLLRGAAMPSADRLPPDIKDLAYRHSFELGHHKWDSDVNEMIRRLGLAKSYRRYWASALAGVILLSFAFWGIWALAPRPGTAILADVAVEKKSARSALLDFRVVNGTGVDLLITRIRLQPMEHKRDCTAGPLDYSKVYPFQDIGGLDPNYGNQEITVSQIVAAGKSDRFGIEVGDTHPGCAPRYWKFKAFLVTSSGVIGGHVVELRLD